MSPFARVTALTLGFSAVLAACNSVDADNDSTPVTTPTEIEYGLSIAERTMIEQNLLERLHRREVRSISGSLRAMCTDVFDLGEPRIVDAILGESTGKVKIDISVTARNPIPAFRHGEPPYFPGPGSCYGAPPGGWTQDQTATSGYEVNLEKWESGWREADPRSMPFFPR